MNSEYKDATKKIAIEGLEDGIVPLIKKLVERCTTHLVIYANESSYDTSWNEPEAITDKIIKSNPDLAIICNAQGGYLNVIESYTKTTTTPLLVFTGGGQDLEEKVQNYTSHLISAPCSIELFNKKIVEILG